MFSSAPPPLPLGLPISGLAPDVILSADLLTSAPFAVPNCVAGGELIPSGWRRQHIPFQMDELTGMTIMKPSYPSNWHPE